MMKGLKLLSAVFVSALVLLSLQHTCSGAGSAMNYHHMICQGEKFTLSCPPLGRDNIQRYLNIRALRIYAHTNSSAISSNHSVCTSMTAQCSRTVHKPTDTGLKSNYKYLSEWIFHRCHGKTECNGTISLWYEMTGTNNNCPPGINYFHKVLVHSLCQVNGSLPSYPPPKATTPKTPPPTPYVSTASAIVVKYGSTSLTDIERIILGVCLGSAVILLLCLFVLLCCYNILRKRRERLLHEKLGGPTADNGAFIEDEQFYTDTWGNREAAVEYTGAKPDEFINHDTINTKLSAVPTPQYAQAGFWTEDEFVTPSSNIPPDYESEKKVELERRKAIDRLHSLQMNNDGASDSQFHEVKL